MAKATDFKYETVKEIMVIGDKKKRHQVVELGHWIVDGEIMSDSSVYVFDFYFDKNGNLVKDKKFVASMSVDIYKAISGKEI